jgi:hypothetical protein
MPRPGPISSTVLCETSPKVSTMRAAKLVAGQKMLSQFRLRLRTARGNDLWHVDPHFPREVDFEVGPRIPAWTLWAPRHIHNSVRPAKPARFWRFLPHEYRIRRFRRRSVFENRRTGRRGRRPAARPGRARTSGQRLPAALSPDQAYRARDGRGSQRHHPFDDEVPLCVGRERRQPGGVRFYFVEYPQYFDRDALYGTPAGDYPDNAERYALFSAPCWKPRKFSVCRKCFTATTGNRR